MLIGNDFLPNLYCLEIGNEGIQTLHNCYIKAITNTEYLLNEANSISQNAFKQLFYNLKEEEGNLIFKKYLKSLRFIKYPDTLLNDCIESETIEGKTVSKLNFEKMKKEYYIKKFGDYNEELIKNIVKEYIRGLQFVITYYVNKIPTYEWCYPYHYSPLMTDVYDIVSNMSVREWNSLQEWNYKPALTLNQALLAVIPPSSSGVLPEDLKKILDSNKDHELFTEDFKIDLEGKQQDYEAVCLLPIVSYKKLKMLCKDQSSHSLPVFI